MICAPRSGALQAVRVTSSLRACRNLASGPVPATVQCAEIRQSGNNCSSCSTSPGWLDVSSGDPP